MQSVRVYTTDSCGYCVQAKNLLKKRQITFEEINVQNDHDKRAWLVKVTGRRTVPQIFIGDDPIGGSDELHAMDKSGELAKRLNG